MASNTTKETTSESIDHKLDQILKSIDSITLKQSNEDHEKIIKLEDQYKIIMNSLDQMQKEWNYLKEMIVPGQMSMIQNQKRIVEDHDQKIEDQEVLIEELKQKVNSFETNPVPIGYIYEQKCGAKEPNELWPNTEWLNISSEYAGQFFRVEGDNAGQFGHIQEQQMQSLEMKSVAVGLTPNWSMALCKVTDVFNLPPLYTGSECGHDNCYYCIQLRYDTNDEIRPRNQAIRIWKRIKAQEDRPFKTQIQNKLKLSKETSDKIQYYFQYLINIIVYTLYTVIFLFVAWVAIFFDFPEDPNPCD